MDVSRQDLVKAIEKKIEFGGTSPHCFVCGKRLEVQSHIIDSTLYSCFWCQLEYYRDPEDGRFYLSESEYRHPTWREVVKGFDLDTGFSGARFEVINTGSATAEKGRKGVWKKYAKGMKPGGNGKNKKGD